MNIMKKRNTGGESCEFKASNFNLVFGIIKESLFIFDTARKKAEFGISEFFLLIYEKIYTSANIISIE